MSEPSFPPVEEQLRVIERGTVDLIERKELEERLKEQKERHDGGNKWVGTGGTSPFGHGGENPAGIRVGGSGGGRSGQGRQSILLSGIIDTTAVP